MPDAPPKPADAPFVAPPSEPTQPEKSPVSPDSPQTSPLSESESNHPLRWIRTIPLTESTLSALINGVLEN